MINLVICFPIASIQEISTSEVGRTGPHDHSGFRTFRSVFQVTPVAPRTGWSAHLHKASRWFICLICGSNVDRYGEGVTGRLWTWKMYLLSCLIILRKFTNVSVHQICKLLQLFHQSSLDVPVVIYLPKCFVEPGIPLQLLFMWPHLSYAFEGAGVII